MNFAFYELFAGPLRVHKNRLLLYYQNIEIGSNTLLGLTLEPRFHAISNIGRNRGLRAGPNSPLMIAFGYIFPCLSLLKRPVCNFVPNLKCCMCV